MAMVSVDSGSLQVNSQSVISLGLRVGGAVLHSSNESGEHLQWHAIMTTPQTLTWYYVRIRCNDLERCYHCCVNCCGSGELHNKDEGGGSSSVEEGNRSAV